MPKYTSEFPPESCLMTQSSCYKGTTRFTPVGVLWHSTGCNNTQIARYVQPSDDAADRDEWIEKLGTNRYNNDWNHSNRQAGVHFFVGKLADGSVTSVQVLPLDYRPWGCGSGKKGSCNGTKENLAPGWLQFEICEDKLTDKDYFETCFEEACQLTAYLCRKFGLDPKGTVSYNGVTVPVILCHKDSARLCLGNDHSDVYTWFNKYGKTMDSVRERVKEIMEENIVLNGWQKQTDGRWFYYDDNERVMAKWIKYNKKWYYLMNDGTMARGWASIDKKTYYLDPKNGDMKTGDVEIDGVTYHFSDSGALEK